MVKRKTIGAIQLIVGIIILFAGIGGLIYSFTLYNELKEEMYDLRPFYDLQDALSSSSSNYTNDTKLLLSWEYLSLTQNQVLFEQQKVIILGVSSSLAIILSLLFIFRGFLNISEQKLKQKTII